ncbi:carbon monoxide dehydrogenase subunit G [Geodermatophilus tzadiensis]|uniref:Carbon monoxide dehydrogenase subunit G n=1 Tax=Geodermatophilus tzadiensis TaxID=1137988 RepID=A0A2T0T6G4_9ACTN|nr:SRPBCC family protein [Geodermatophilus tzadiensis]PRY41232.1 carbon monoxide dehydrogenase subunit G [Geodermatophilus tzadiensis]
MQLENSFTVPVPVDEAWRVLLDIERIAPCMPGAALDSVEGDSFTGRVKVKLGPINLTYQGKASFIEKDEAAHKAVIDGRGKDQRGNGTAAALITAQLKDEGSSTRVDVLTDLNITGRPAQFGRGVMTDVGNKLLGQFADKLAAQLGEGDAQGDAARAEAARVDAPGPVTATATGVVEEVAASVEQTPGDNAVAQKVRDAGTATREAAAAATDSSAGRHAAEANPPTAPITAVGSTDTAPVSAVAAGGDSVPAGTGAVPSGPSSGTTAPPTRPATGAPPRSTPAAAPRQPAAEPEPIDLLEVAGGAAAARFALPAAGVAAVLLLVTLAVRRRRRR